MIESISISNAGTFGSSPEVMRQFSKFNFIFGANGTGKTTLSRIIAADSNFLGCKVTWSGGTKQQAMVYNRDFVDRNFNESTELRGVFTLGEQQVDTLAKIEEAKKEIDALTKKIEALTEGLQGADGTGGKKGELASLEDKLQTKCWNVYSKCKEKFSSAFEGARKSKKDFTARVQREVQTNATVLLPLQELEKKAETIFGPTPTLEQVIPSVNKDYLTQHETNPILKKRVIGKDDVDVAAIINKLGNSDWVRRGQTFYSANNGICPFCQQSTTEEFAESLKSYFDETFLNDSMAIDDLATNYAADAARLQQQLSQIIAAPPKYLDLAAIEAEKKLLDSKVTINNQLLARKKKEPSQVVELESVNNVLSAIAVQIESANAKILKHNETVNNLAEERISLTGQIWKFVLEELKVDFDEDKRLREGLNKAIAAITANIELFKADKTKMAIAVRDLERQTTSVQPTIDAINSLLSSFGFQSFKLAKAASGTSYKLVRPNGSDAKATLSEGEKTFVTFLYFYHLLKGSESESGMSTDRVVVFDDPVSSLDSDILFIVGTLIKGLFEEVRAGKGYIKQIFILTHNVYFHKEVSFNQSRRGGAMSEETFWIVRKSDSLSRVVSYDHNPVKTSYDLLWAEVRNPDRGNLTIPNTLRRILENYFTILGGLNADKIFGQFEGKDRLHCKALFSWVNDGSHFAHDDLYVSIDTSMVETYLKVFRAIFEKTNHGEHYKMMMGDAYKEEPVLLKPIVVPEKSVLVVEPTVLVEPRLPIEPVLANLKSAGEKAMPTKKRLKTKKSEPENTPLFGEEMPP
jgi:wobble nucleotide-excising tRNase